MTDSTGPAPRPRRPAWRVTPDRVSEAFAHQRRIDPFGHDVHTLMAVLACLALGSTTTGVEIGAIPVLCAFAIRFHRHWRTQVCLVLQPLLLVVLAWAVLAFASGLWTAGDSAAWIDEFGVLRAGLLTLAIWPVADRRRLLLGAMAIGLLGGQIPQLIHALGRTLDIDWMTWDRLPGRNSGWWRPVVGGSLLTASLGLHLPAALWGRGRWRVAGVACSGLVLLGIAATGTRGAWLAAAGLIALAGATAVWRVRPRSRLIRPALAMAGVALVVGAIAWLTIGDRLRDRFEAGRAEVAGAIERKEFQSDTGARLLMNWWAIEALAERPLSGIGMGAYRAWTRAHVIEQGIDPATRNYHGHAHNAILHAGATLGVPGAALSIAFAALAISGAARRREGDGPRGYADGPCFALIGLLLVSAFDSVQVNTNTAALLAALTIFAVRHRPPPTDADRGDGPDETTTPPRPSG